MWREVLPAEQFLRRPRLSRIYFHKKFFNYPLRLGNTLKGLGLWTSARIVLSYLHAQLSPQRPEITFEQWVSNRFGRRLYELFFKTYTEKVWGIPCSEIMAEWAAQRIKGSYYWAPTYAPTLAGSDHVVVSGDIKYYQIYCNHRFAFVMARDVEIVSDVER